MKKIFKNIILDTIFLAILYFILSYVLKSFNLVFMQWIRNLACFAICIGFILGLIQINIKLSKKNIVLGIIVWIIFTFIIIAMAVVGLFYLIFFYDPECITNYEGRKMVQETRSVWKSNYIKYYDYINPFARSKQERVHVQYDDAIAENEYAGTTYYNEKGEKVEDINGTKYVDLTALTSFPTEKISYEKVKEILEYIKENYSNNYYDIEDEEDILCIYFTKNPKKIVDNNRKKRINNIIDSFLENELKKEDSLYNVLINDGNIRIINIYSSNSWQYKNECSIEDDEKLSNYSKEIIEDFLNSEDTKSREIYISYNRNLSIKIKYRSFINAKKLDKDNEIAENIGYYEYYINGELNGVYYYPTWKINLSEDNEKMKLCLSSKNDSIVICEFLK